MTIVKQYVENQIARLIQQMVRATEWENRPNRDAELSRLAGRMRRLTNIAWNSGR